MHCFSERVGAEVIECACVIELPELKVCMILQTLLSNLIKLKVGAIVS